MISEIPSRSFWLRRKTAAALAICLFAATILEVLVGEGGGADRALSAFGHLSYFFAAMLFATLAVNLDQSIRRCKSDKKKSFSPAFAILTFSYVSLSAGFLYALTLCITDKSWHSLLRGILANSPGIGLYVGARYSIDFRGTHTNDSKRSFSSGICTRKE